MEFFVTDAWAQAAPSTTGGMLGTILPLLLIFVVFYFLLIRPQTKRAKEHREMIGKLAVGDEVVTNGGLLGRITEVSDSFVTLQVATGDRSTDRRRYARFSREGRRFRACRSRGRRSERRRQ